MDSRSSLGRASGPREQPEPDGNTLTHEELRQNQVNAVWTIAMEEMLIYFVRVNRLFWDRKHPHYTKPMMKRKKVEEIAAIIRKEAAPEGGLAFSAEDVWKKYKNLRNFFMREVKRTCEKRHELGDDTYTSKWVHFNRMRFLLTPLKLMLGKSHPNTFCQPVRRNHFSVKKETQDISTAIYDESARLHQDYQEEVRVGGEWEGASEQVSSSSMASTGPIPPTAPQPEQLSANNESFSPTQRRNKPNRARVVINSNDLQKASKILHKLENNQGDVAEKFGKFVATSIRTLQADRQHDLMSKITHVMSEFHKKQD